MALYPTLNLPDRLGRWATDSGAILEPPAGLKDTGWSENTKIPARMINWLWNYAYEWHKRIGSVAVSNVEYDYFITPITNQSIIGSSYSYHANHKRFLIGGTPGSGYLHNSADTYTWLSSGLGGTNAFCGTDSGINVTLDKYWVGCSNGFAAYTTTGTGSLVVDTTSAGGAVKSIGTKYPDSPFVVAAKNGSVIKINSTGVYGSWTNPSVSPPSPLAEEGNIIHAVGPTWLYITYTTGSAKLYKSIDDGDTWVETATLIDKSTCTWRRIAYNQNNDILLVTGLNASSKAVIAYSADLGVTWAYSTINVKKTSDNDYQLGIPYYCGGSFWVIPVQTLGTKPEVKFLLSADNGVSWNEVEIFGLPYAFTINTFCCNTERLIGVGSLDGSNNNFIARGLKLLL